LAEEIDFEIGHSQLSNLRDLDLGSGHMAYRHASTSVYVNGKLKLIENLT